MSVSGISSVSDFILGYFILNEPVEYWNIILLLRNCENNMLLLGGGSQSNMLLLGRSQNNIILLGRCNMLLLGRSQSNMLLLVTVKAKCFCYGGVNVYASAREESK